jgi:hypothetical protein
VCGLKSWRRLTRRSGSCDWAAKRGKPNQHLSDILVRLGKGRWVGRVGRPRAQKKRQVPRKCFEGALERARCHKAHHACTRLPLQGSEEYRSPRRRVPSRTREQSENSTAPTSPAHAAAAAVATGTAPPRPPDRDLSRSSSCASDCLLHVHIRAAFIVQACF